MLETASKMSRLVRYLGDDGCQAILNKLPVDEAIEILKWRRENSKSAAETILAMHDGGDLEQTAQHAILATPLWVLNRLFGAGPTHPPGATMQRAVASIQTQVAEALKGMAAAEFDLLAENQEVPWAPPQHDVPRLNSPNALIEPKRDIRGGTEAKKPSKSGRHPGKDYREADQPLVERVIAGVQDGTYRNPYDGALALADKAEGHAKPKSKAQRLLRRIQGGQY